MNKRIKRAVVLIGVLILYCEALHGGISACQSYLDASSFITKDFSSMRRIGHKGVEHLYKRELLQLLNKRIGVYESDEISNTDCDELEGANRLVLKIDRCARATLFKKDASGNRKIIKGMNSGIVSDLSIFIGPKDHGLLFWYAVISNNLYTLFSPNKLQVPIRFKRIELLPYATQLPQANSNYYLSCDEFDSRQKRKKPLGVFVSNDSAQVTKRSGVEKHYLFCGNAEVYSVFYKDSFYWYDTNLDSREFGETIGPFGLYAYKGDIIRFSHVPVGQNEINLIRMNVAVDSYAPSNRIASMRHGCEVFNRIAERNMSEYEKGKFKLNAAVFRRCDIPSMTLKNLRICCMDEEITNYENVRYYYKLIMDCVRK